MIRSRLLVPFLLFAACKQEPAVPAIPEAQLFDASRNPAADLSIAEQEAKTTGRRILLEVGRNTCSWTRKMDGLITTDDELDALVHRSYVHLRVNRSDEQPNADFLAQFPPIPGVPHFFVLDADGEVLHSQDTGLLEVGDRHDRAKVLAFLTLWAR